MSYTELENGYRTPPRMTNSEVRDYMFQRAREMEQEMDVWKKLYIELWCAIWQEPVEEFHNEEESLEQKHQDALHEANEQAKIVTRVRSASLRG